MENYDIQFSDYWRVIRKRKWSILYTFGIIMASTIVFTNLQTPVYQTAVEIKVDIKTPEPSLTPSGIENLSTELQELKSLNIIGKVVERVDALPAEPEAREMMRYSLARKYQEDITLSQIPDTNIINISVNSENPDKAVLLANAIVDVYVEQSLSGGNAQGKAVLEYTRKKQAKLEEKIKSGEKELQKIKFVEKIFMGTPQVKSTLERMDVSQTLEFENELLKINYQLDSIGKVIQAKREEGKLAFLPDDFFSESLIFDGLRKDLLELEFERFLLLVDYTEKHPSVIKQDRIISDTKNKIVGFIKNSLKRPLTPQMEEDLSLVVDKLFMQAKQEVLSRIVNKSYSEIGALSTDQVQFNDLQRGVDRTIDEYKRISEKQEDTELSLASDVVDVSVVSPPQTPREPIRPNKKINYLMGSLVGILFGLMLAFILESLDATIGTIEDVEKLLQLPVLGIIPFIRTGGSLFNLQSYHENKEQKERRLMNERLVTMFQHNSQEAESFRHLRTNVIEKIKNGNKKVILITSSDRQEGKSTISSNLAVSLAQLGKRTLLIEANLRRPTISKIFGLSREPGLSEILVGKYSWENAMKAPADILLGQMDVEGALEIPGIDNLHIITCGHMVANPAETLNYLQLASLFQDLKERFDVILVDCSPIMPVPDSVILGNKVDGVIVVYKVGGTNKETLRRACLQLRNVNAHIIGVVLNQLNIEAQMGVAAYYHRYYGESTRLEGNFIQNILKRFNS